ncbi:MAG: hypothetical protein MI861_05910, partial [Pirellulales bacterium]|nr:hypothetical protein [Pirellulales bacterium]
MTTDDFLREQMERSQREQTRRRRDNQSRRRQMYFLGGILFLAMLLLGAPSLISHSSLGRSLLRQTAADYGIDATADSVRVGWITPLRITGLQVRGASGASELIVDQLDADVTVTDLLRSSFEDLGEVVLRRVNLACAMREGGCSLEDDLAAFLESDRESAGGELTLKLQEITVTVTDSVSGNAWKVTQSNADIQLDGDQTRATFAGVLSEPAGGGGSIQGSVALTQPEWRLELQSESLPLSVVSLIRRRFPEAAGSIPSQVAGDATGALRITGTADGTVQATVTAMQVRNLTAADQGVRRWSNQLATLDGDLRLENNRLMGRGLRATTDFATATIDGAFSRSFSLVGSQDNPLRWLEALDGSATAEVDLARLEQAWPGLLPLKNDAQLVSGRAVAKFDSLPLSDRGKRCQLVVRSDEIRARSRGRAVTIDPIEINAIVSNSQGHLIAEQFEWKSAFGSAIGRGDLRSGAATVDIHFGRLANLLRPIVALSAGDLAGSAKGEIRWNASQDNVWRLTGSGDAANLAFTLPGGKIFQRQSIHGDVEAVGRWGGHSLDELSSAAVTLVTQGMDIRAELLQPVRQPSAQVPIPIRIQGSGRVETLAETLAPWMPTQLHDAEGGFNLSVRGDVSAGQNRLKVAAIELTNPRFAYGNRHFSQPSVKVLFNGEYAWPEGDFRSESLTVEADALTAAVRGVASQ